MVEVRIGGLSYQYLLQLPKWELVRMARKAKEALPHEDIVTSGRKADIAYSIMAAAQRNPVQGDG